MRASPQNSRSASAPPKECKQRSNRTSKRSSLAGGFVWGQPPSAVQSSKARQALYSHLMRDFRFSGVLGYRVTVSMKTLSVIATLLLCFLLCGFQQEPSSTQQKPGSKVASANQQKADSGKEPHGAAPSGQPATDATDKNAVAPTAPRQSDRVEVTALPPEIAVKQVKDSIDRTIMWCTIILTGVGIGGTVVAVWTLLAIKDQAKTLHEHSEELRKLAGAARDNAAAARASAEFSQRAVRNSERADILVDAVSIV